MAVTKIKAVRGKSGITRSTKYIKNEDKTTVGIGDIEKSASEAKQIDEMDKLQEDWFSDSGNEFKTDITEENKAITSAVDYAMNPDKTTDEEIRLVSGHNCNPITAAEEMQMLVDFWKTERRMENNDKDAYHLIQSFDPKDNEHLTYQMAHEIGLKLCSEIENIHDKKLEHERHYKMLVCTHVDKNHIHNHIVFCPYDIDTGYKYHDNMITYKKIREANDRLCKEYDLSIVMDPDEDRKRAYVEEMAKKTGNSWKDNIRKDIEAMKSVCSDWDSFINYMEIAGYQVNQGKYITYTDKEGHKVRDKTLGREWTKAEIQKYWEEMNKESEPTVPKEEVYYFEKDKVNTKTNKPYRIKVFDDEGRRRNKLELILLLAIDILKNEDVSNRAYNPYEKTIYARKNYKLNQMMETLSLIKDENISSIEDISIRLNEVGKKISRYKLELKKSESSLAKMDNVKKAIEGYLAVKDIVDKINSMDNGPEKEKAIEENKESINEYKKHKSVLYRARCVTDEQIDDFNLRYINMKNNISSLNTRIKEESAEYGRIKKIQNNVEAAQNKQFLYSQIEENKDIDTKSR